VLTYTFPITIATPEPASPIRIVLPSAAQQEILSAQTASALQIQGVLDGVAIYMELASYSHARDLVYKAYYEPYAKAIAHEFRVALEAFLMEPGMSPEVLDEIEQDVEEKCKLGSTVRLSTVMGENACNSRPFYMLGGQRLKGGITPVSSMQASQLRSDYWSGRDSTALGIGNWLTNSGIDASSPAWLKSAHLWYNPSAILHYRPRLKAWWAPGNLPTAGSQDCPQAPQATGAIQCDEFPNAASYEGGPALSSPIFKSPAWLRGINGPDNLCDGCSYGIFLVWARLGAAYAALSAVDMGLRTVEPWDLPSVSFFQSAFPYVEVRSFGMRMVNGRPDFRFL
jgi:hypothetical protein